MAPPPLATAYGDWYSFNVLPRIGQLVAGDAAQLPLPRRVDPHAPGPGGKLQGDDEERRLPATSAVRNLSAGVVAPA